MLIIELTEFFSFGIYWIALTLAIHHANERIKTSATPADPLTRPPQEVSYRIANGEEPISEMEADNMKLVRREIDHANFVEPVPEVRLIP